MFRRFSLIFQALRRILVYPLSYLVARDASIWIFGSSRGSFSDNSKYMFLWASEYLPQIRVVWLSESKETCAFLKKVGYEAYYCRSIRGIFLRLKAAAYIYSYSLNDIGFSLSGGALKVNLWHGVGLKKIEFKINNGASKKYYRQTPLNPYRFITPEKFIRPNLFVCPSPMMEQHFRECLRLNEQNCLRAGYPRLDFHSDQRILRRISNIDNENEFLRYQHDFETVLLYMPTWRDSGRAGIRDALPDLTVLNDSLRRSNSILLIKAHPAERFFLNEHQSNIAIWPSGLDVYPFLRKIDCLITDYSSILYDFIAVGGRNVILYTYDYAEYMQHSRDFAFPYDENTFGLRISSFTELCAKFERLDFEDGPDPEELMNRFWSYASRGSCEVISAKIRDALCKL